MSRAFPLLRRTSVLVAVLASLVLGDSAGAASVFDPRLHFRTLSTPHFAIHFHQGEERLAARLATIAEEVWPKVGQAFGIEAPRRTHVVLVDQSELANGWATPLPYNLIVINAAAPSGSEFIGRADDWLRVVFIHEFTHVTHFDRSEGWARVVRSILGRTPLAFPNLWLPAWQVEGLATWQESALTGEGRLHAGDFRAIEREAARDARVEPLDRVNGGLTAWPSGLAPYAFGLGFHQYLAERFGAERFGELASRTARRFPFFASSAFSTVYQESLGSLWKDYARALQEASSQTVAAEAAPRRITHHGYIVSGPRFASPACPACPAEIVYSTRNPHAFPALHSVSVDGTSSRQLATRYLGSTSGLGHDRIVFDQQELRRNVALVSDLYMLNRRTGHVRALTSGRRLLDPDLSPDNTAIVCVQENRGQRDLVLIRLRSGGDDAIVDEITTIAAEPDTQFNTPRWSPDGRRVVAERHRHGGSSELVVVDVASRALEIVASDPAARIVTPTWRPDGRAVVAAADFGEDTFNLYEFAVERLPAASRRLTSTSGGALWPDVSADGRTLVFAGYTADGFDVFTLPYPAEAPEIESLRPVSADPGPERVDSPAMPLVQTARTYSPLSTLLPTSWTPLIESTADATRVGILTSGVDVLSRHAYTASMTWIVSRSDRSTGPPIGEPDWSAYYMYDRWLPTLFGSASSDTLLAAGRPDADGRPTPGTLRELEFEAGVFLPMRRVRSSERIIASVVRTSSRFTTPTGVAERSRTAARAGAGLNTAHTYGYSISPERGLSAGVTAEYVPAADDNATTTMLTADARAFLPSFAPHHVVAVRAAGGVSLGDRELRRTFLLGGAGPNASVLDFGHDAFSLLRAFPAHTFAGTRGAVVNADYRFPFKRFERGIGTLPFFVHTAHAAVFADAGHVWTDRFDRRDIKTSFGAELALDLLVGYSFPFTVVGGAAWGTDGAEHRQATTAYLRIGRAF